MLVILFFSNYFCQKFKSSIYSQFLVYIPYSNLSVKLWLCPDMMSYLSIALFDWQGSWLYMKLTSYLCIIKHSFDSVFLIDYLCKKQLETVVFIKFPQCYSNSNFLQEQKMQPLFLDILYGPWSTRGKSCWMPHTIINFFYSWYCTVLMF